jgi:hypothetical protein
MLPAGIGYMAGCWLVIMLVGSRGRVGLVTPTPNGHLPALFKGPFHVQLGELGFVRWIGPLEIGVHPRFCLRDGMRLVVLVPQDQTAVYEACNLKGYKLRLSG